MVAAGLSGLKAFLLVSAKSLLKSCSIRSSLASLSLEIMATTCCGWLNLVSSLDSAKSYPASPLLLSMQQASYSFE